LLIGGILKGQELMLNARVTATIAQIRSYEAAATTFRDSYAAIPGDMLGAATRLPGCTAACDPDTGAGNSIVGSPTWSTGWASQFVALSGSGVGRETVLFWLHLLQADLISGISTDAITATTAQWGITHPSARINGGFVVGYADGVANPPGGATTTTRPTGMVLALTNAPDAALGTTAGQNPLTASKAAQIDRKMDDGRPSSGFVQGYGVTASCLTTAAAPVYAEATTGNDCGLIFRIQG
jgi:hypothetical protein